MLYKSDTREEAFDATMFQTWALHAPLPFPKFIDTWYAIDGILRTTHLSRRQSSSKIGFLNDGEIGVRIVGHFC